jgi:hypothetical protein
MKWQAVAKQSDVNGGKFGFKLRFGWFGGAVR